MTMIDKQKSLAWIIKYRPEKLDDVVGKEAKHIKNYIEKGNLPHLLLVSRNPGLGKTTIAKAIIKELDADYLEMNSSVDRGIEVIRDKILHFVSTMSSNNQKKIVFFDEADGLTPISQESMRNLMETHAHNVIFILTANREEKIIDPIKDRCEVFKFGKHDIEEVYSYLVNICEKEELNYTREGIVKLIELYSPGIRSMVGQLQKIKNMDVGGVTVENVDLVDDYKEFWEKLKQDKVLECQKDFIVNNLEHEKILKYIFNQLFEDKTLNNKQKIYLSKTLGDLSYKLSGSTFDEHMIFVGGIVDIYSALKK